VAHDGAALVAAAIERVRPDTIVTFGPDGMTGHPDHRAVSAWTTTAWEATGRAAQLWYATLTPGFHEEWGALGEQLGLWAYGAPPPCTPVEHLAATVHLEGSARERKLAALRAHASQTDALAALVGEATLRDWWATESFVEVAPALSARS
jgi:LmbE family N-acetylglucosaminyl deacetylase